MNRSRMFFTVAWLLGLTLFSAGQASAVAYDRALVLRLVNEALKSIPFDESLLTVQSPPNWAEGLKFDSIAAIMKADPPAKEELPPEAVRRIEYQGKVIRFEPDRGFIRFNDRKRNWNILADAKIKPIDPKTAQGFVLETFKALRMPAAELNDAFVRSQIARGALIRGTARPQEFTMYQIVVLRRSIENTKLKLRIPVLHSIGMAAVANEGTSEQAVPAIQRWLSKWPPFAMSGALKLRAPDAIASQAVAAILRETLSDEDKKGGEIGKIVATLAYSDRYDAPNEPSDSEQKRQSKSLFLPVAAFAVLPPEGSTSPPMLLEIPMAQ